MHMYIYIHEQGIEEAHRAGRFQKKPIGPLGATLKVDPKWGKVRRGEGGMRALSSSVVPQPSLRFLMQRDMTFVYLLHCTGDGAALDSFPREIHRGL